MRKITKSLEKILKEHPPIPATNLQSEQQKSVQKTAPPPKQTKPKSGNGSETATPPQRTIKSNKSADAPIQLPPTKESKQPKPTPQHPQKPSGKTQVKHTVPQPAPEQTKRQPVNPSGSMPNVPRQKRKESEPKQEDRFVPKKAQAPIGKKSTGDNRRFQLPPGTNKGTAGAPSGGLKRPPRTLQSQGSFHPSPTGKIIDPAAAKPDPKRFAKYARTLTLGGAAVGAASMSSSGEAVSAPDVATKATKEPSVLNKLNMPTFQATPDVPEMDTASLKEEPEPHPVANSVTVTVPQPELIDEPQVTINPVIVQEPSTTQSSINIEPVMSAEQADEQSPIVDGYDPNVYSDLIKQEAEEEEKQEWGYSFILVIVFTIIGSVTIAVYIVLLRSNFSIANIMVNVSIISLLIFLFAVIGRYLALLFLSFLHHARMSTFDDDDVFQHYKVSILVPGYNEGPVIAASIESLLDMDYHNYEIIVIDDGSTDDTLEIARTMEGTHGNVEVLVLTQENGGKSHALNHGASMATGDIIVCMDADSKLSPNTLKAGVRYFQDPKMGAVAGNVKVVNRDKMLTNLQALEYIEGLNLVRRAQAFFKAVNIVPGPIGFFRRSIIKDIGGWESDTYAEDCDLTLKVLAHKWRIDYEPGAISYTEAPEKLMELLKQRYRWTRGILQSIRKNRYNLINPKVGWRVMLTMWQMIFEAILWPMANILAQLMMIVVALLYGMSPLIVLWWVQLTALDILAALLTVAVEREKLYLIWYAFLYRLVFVQIVDMAKLIATVEELLGTKMQWGKVDRLGKL